MASRNIGHVRWLKRRKRWYLDLFLDGKRHHIYSYQGVSFKQRDYAEDVLTLIRGEISSKTFDIRKYKKGAQLTAKVYAEKWVDSLSLQPATMKDYRYSIRNFIGPFFKDLDIRDIRHHHLIEFKTSLSKQVSDKTAFNIMSCLKTMLRYAWRNGDIQIVPPFPRLEYTKPPIRWLDEEAQVRVIEAIPEADRYIFWFMKWYGVRPGEARALQKSDLQNDHITITHSYSLNKLVNTTKTHRIRVLPRLDLFDNLLKEMPGRLGPFVFTRSRDGKPYAKRDLNVLWNRACETVGVKINLYNGLKHSLGMHLLERGVPKEMVQKIYGHTRSDMTDRYCDYQTKQMKVALESVVSEVVPFGKLGTGDNKIIS
jgi:integrase